MHSEPHVVVNHAQPRPAFVLFRNALREQHRPDHLDAMAVIYIIMKPRKQVLRLGHERLVLRGVASHGVRLQRRAAPGNVLDDVHPDLPLEQTDFHVERDPGELVNGEEYGCRVDVVAWLRGQSLGSILEDTQCSYMRKKSYFGMCGGCHADAAATQADT